MKGRSACGKALAKASCIKLVGQNCTRGSTLCIGAISSAGPIAQPTCHPVALKVLPADEIVMVFENMPGRDAKCVCPWTLEFCDPGMEGGGL